MKFEKTFKNNEHSNNSMNDKVINNHYGISGILDLILEGLRSSGKNLQALEPNDLLQLMNSIPEEKNLQLNLQILYKFNLIIRYLM